MSDKPTTFWPKRDEDGRHITRDCDLPELPSIEKLKIGSRLSLQDRIDSMTVKFKATHENTEKKHPKCNICKDTGHYRHRKDGLLFVSICNCPDHLCKTCGESKYMLSTAPLNTGIISNYFACLNNECIPK